MNRLFAVIRRRGSCWQPGVSIESQDQWTAHAAFMTNLEHEGFILLAGPLDGTNDVLLIIRARSSEEIEERLAADPWTSLELLNLGSITPWNLRLGKL